MISSRKLIILDELPFGRKRKIHKIMIIIVMMSLMLCKNNLAFVMNGRIFVILSFMELLMSLLIVIIDVIFKVHYHY